MYMNVKNIIYVKHSEAHLYKLPTSNKILSRFRCRCNMCVKKGDWRQISLRINFVQCFTMIIMCGSKSYTKNSHVHVCTNLAN